MTGPDTGPARSDPVAGLLPGYVWALETRSDDLLVLSLDAAHHYRVPLSVFMDDWTPHDQAAAIAKMLHQRAQELRRCGRCGTAPDDWEGTRETPFVGVLETCEGCRQLAVAAEQLDQGDTKASRWTRAVLWPVEKWRRHQAEIDDLWGDRDT